jgi:signal peptidase I
MSDDAPAPRRHVGLALLLSVLCTGLGQIYAGRGRRGGILIALALLQQPALRLLCHVGPSNAVLVALGGIPAFGLGLFVFALVDAGRLAARASRPYRPRAYNHAWLYAGLILFAAVWDVGGALWTRAMGFEAFRSASDSMAPGIRRGERFLVNKTRVEDLRRGDVVVFRRPGLRRRDYVKRIVALAGESVRVAGGRVWIDGRPLRYRDRGDGVVGESDGRRTWRVKPGEGGAPQAAVVVPPDCVYVLGDDRAGSEDSRAFGSVPLGDVLGVAEYVIWPDPHLVR